MKIDYDKHRENYMEQLKEKINKNIAYHVERVAEKAHRHFLLVIIVDGIKIFGIIDILLLTS